MIGEPVSLTVRKEFPRPTAEQIAAFQGLATGFVVDAQNGTGALDHRIKPLPVSYTHLTLPTILLV